MRKPINKKIMSVMLEAMVEHHIETGGQVTVEKPVEFDRPKNFNFNVLNKSRNCGAGRGGILHNAGIPRVI